MLCDGAFCWFLIAFVTERSEEKVKQEIKKLAKVGEKDAAKMLARELVASKKGKERMYEAKARLNSVVLQLSEQLATIRMTKAISASTQAMEGRMCSLLFSFVTLVAAMNRLINMPMISATMREMGRQMEKAGFIQELMSETLELNEDGLDEEAQEEVDKVFEELTLGLDLPDAAKPNKVSSQQKSAQQSQAAKLDN